jgi:AcrR family transcriptional regulator
MSPSIVQSRAAERTKFSPTRRYGAELEDAIYEAVFEELIEKGFAKLSFDAVAKRANTGKAALYRRWSSRHDLVLDAFASVPVEDPPELEQDLRVDLINYFSFHFLRVINPLADEAGRRLVGDALRNPELLKAVGDPAWTRGYHGLRRIIRGAAERGEIPSDSVAPEVLEAVPGMLFNRFIWNWGKMTRAHITRVIDHVLLPLLGYDQD